LQIATPRAEPAAPVPGPISARLVEPQAPGAPPAPVAGPPVEQAAPAGADPETDDKPATEPMARSEAAAEPSSAQPEAKIEAKAKPEIAAKPKPVPRAPSKPKPTRVAKPKPKSEALRARPKSDPVVASVTPRPSRPPSAPAEPSPGASASATPLPTAASGAPVVDQDLLARYRLQLISAARRYKRYPRAALDNQWEGAAEVAMVIGDNGRIREVTISKSSGHDVLDRQAIDMFRKAKPLVPIPAGLRGREFRVTLKAIYSLRDPDA